MSLLVKLFLFAPAWIAALVGIPAALIFCVYFFFKEQYNATWGEPKKEDNRTEEEKQLDRLKKYMKYMEEE